MGCSHMKISTKAKKLIYPCIGQTSLEEPPVAGGLDKTSLSGDEGSKEKADIMMQ